MWIECPSFSFHFKFSLFVFCSWVCDFQHIGGKLSLPGCNPCNSGYSRSVVLPFLLLYIFSLCLSKFGHFCRDSNLPHRQGGLVGHLIPGHENIRIHRLNYSSLTCKQWMNVQSRLCKIMWINLASLSQNTTHKWKLFLSDVNVLKASWKYVELLVLLRWMHEDLNLIMVPACIARAFSHKDVVYMYTHTYTQAHTLGVGDVLFHSVRKFCRCHYEHVHTGSGSWQTSPSVLLNWKKKKSFIIYPTCYLLTKEKEAVAKNK